MGDIIGAIVDGLASVIKFFATIGGGHTAIGIILFTVSIRLLLLPLTLKAVRSSRAMQHTGTLSATAATSRRAPSVPPAAHRST